MIDRRQFVKRHTLAYATTTGALFVSGAAMTQDDEKKSDDDAKQQQQEKKRPPRIDLDMVKEMVGVSHGKFERVKELVVEEPKLVNACHDWTAGDFETALGAASHVGNREIALFLLENGARMDIFAATMLGRIDIVKPTLTAFPEMIDTPGPHGIPLIKHAEYGKEEAEEVLEFLKSLKDA